MVLIKIKIILMLVINMIVFSFAQAKEKDETVLKKIISKQALYNIRFVSKDSSFTIYQKHTGGLFLSTNYSVKKIIDSNDNTQFNVIGSKKLKSIIITKKQKFHQEFNPNTEKDIFYMQYDLSDLPIFLGKGINPKVHRSGDFVTYIQPSQNRLVVHKLSLPTKTMTIKLSKKVNPFFINQVEMMDDLSIIIYQQNESGIGFVTKTSLEDKKSQIIKKLKNYHSKLEMCLVDNQLFIFETRHIASEKNYSQLSTIPVNLTEEKILYVSKKTDLGHIACNIRKDHIYFIKNYSDTDKNYFDVAILNTQNKSINRVTNEDYITSIFEMDGRLIAINNGVQMLLFGESSLKKDSIPSMQ
jgi:hypothetical protein